MSENPSSTEEDQPPPRNDNNQRQIGAGRGNSSRTVNQPPPRNQLNPMANPHHPSPPITRRTTPRILIIPSEANIVSVLGSLSRTYRQPFYIVAARGYFSQGTVLTIPFRQHMMCIGPAPILYLSGWFHPTIRSGSGPIAFSYTNGILHVYIPGVPHGVAIATSLIAYGSVEVDVIFLCGPGSAIQPLARTESIREPVYVEQL